VHAVYVIFRLSHAWSYMGLLSSQAADRKEETRILGVLLVWP
jgi:hypothetical protein